MKKNVASQVVVAQLVSKTDGSAVTSGTTTVYVLGDAGTQATGSVGSGAGTHEGNGVWSYAPAQAETNYDNVAFTFTNTSAVNATIQIYTSFPQTGDNYPRLGAPAGASHAADVAAVKAVLPAALVSGRIDASVGAYQSGLTPLQPTTAGRTLDVTATGEAGVDWANVGSPTTTVNLSGTTISTSQAVASVSGAVGSVTGAVASVTGNVGGNVTGSVGSVVGAVGSVTGAVGSVTGNVGGNVTGSVGSLAAQAKLDVNAEADTAIADAALATASNLATVAAYVDTEVGAIKAVTDKVDTALESDAGVYRFTANALEQSPAGGGGSGPTAVEIADEVETRTIAAVTLVNGLAANTVTASALASDAVSEIQTGLATAASLSTLDGKADAIKAKTDSLTFSTAGQVDANVQYVNDVAVTGNGQPGTEWGPA